MSGAIDVTEVIRASAARVEAGSRAFTPLPEGSPRLHLVFLDGLRGFAAFWVLLNHAMGTLPQLLPARGVSTAVPRLILTVVGAGHFAVDVFIVLSGFCLMIPVARRGALEGGPARFFGKRVHRILPPYFACLLIMLAYGLCVRHFGKQIQPLPSPRVIVLNLLLLEDWAPGANAINGVFWSVAVEWKIYFLFPLFILLWRRSTALMLLMASLIGLSLTPLLHVAFPENNLSRACPWFVILFALGVVSAGLVFNGRRLGASTNPSVIFGSVTVIFALAAFGFCAICPPVNGLNNEGTAVDWRLPIADLLAGIAIAAAIGGLANWVAEGKKRRALAFFEFKPLVWIGMMGYSLYLLHPLALNVLDAIGNRLTSHPTTRGLIVLLAGIPSSLALSYAFFLVVERRFLNRKPARPQRSVNVAPA
jgi:peptidoglycan/LPS O-acetylase OafA/YrhL